MVRVDFSVYKTIHCCPKWWVNFINKVYFDDKLQDLYKALDEKIAQFGGKIIDSKDCPDMVECLEFQSEEDFIAFKLHWTLYGKTSIGNEKVS